MAAMAESAVVRQGHLRKLKTMKKKYFVLRAETSESTARLEYYESEKKFRSGAAPRRVLLLKSCYNITRRLDLKQKHVIALFTKEEQLCIVAENEQDLHAWLTAIRKQFQTDDASDELLHPIQHVWQVNVQKKGLGASQNIQGLYNLCLTDKTLALVKIKSQNNVISDLGIPERVEYSLKNIRRCGDSECFFYMEVGRQTTTGAGELWMHSDDSNIAQSMHSTIYHAMRNCAKETENEKDHIVIPNKHLLEGSHPLPARRQTYSDGRGRAGFYTDCSLRKRCDTMPTRGAGERTRERDALHSSLDSSRDDIDSISEWYRTPRIPEEPDCCDIMSKDFMSMTTRGGSVAHSRTSSVGVDETDAGEPALPDGYLPMAPGHEPPGPVSSGGSVCSGTPSTDPRFSEYQLEPATSHIAEERSARAYSVGSRPAARAEPARLRAYSAGARRKPPPPVARPQRAQCAQRAQHAHPRASAEDLMELDFSSNSPAPGVVAARTPPAGLCGFADASRRDADEYVDMSPRNAGYVEMRPGDVAPAPLAPPSPAAPDGYVEMSYGRAPARPVAVPAPRRPPPAAGSPDERRRRREPRAPPGPQAPLRAAADSPSSPPESEPPEPDDERRHLGTVRETSEDGRRSPELRERAEASPSPRRATPAAGLPGAAAAPEAEGAPAEPAAVRTDDVGSECPASSEPRRTAPTGRTISLPISPVRSGGRSGRERNAVPPPAELHYAALDLEPRRAPAAPAPRLYTQIDFMRSAEKYAADAS